MSAKPRRKRARSCPICGRPPVEAFKPFCSRRCADIDLGRWLGEDYRIPADESSEEAGDDGDEGADGENGGRSWH